MKSGTLCVRGRFTWGQGVPEHSYGDISFRDVPSPQRIFKSFYAAETSVLGTLLLVRLDQYVVSEHFKLLHEVDLMRSFQFFCVVQSSGFRAPQVFKQRLT